MKLFLKQILKYYLKLITKLVLLIHRPTVIAIAGSTNKNFVKYALIEELKGLGLEVRANPKNFNTEIGLPLAVLYLKSGYNRYSRWLPAILKAPLLIFKTSFPKYLVLTLGTSDKGDMKYLLSIIKPKISIITELNQRYLEGFKNLQDLMGEYNLLASKTSKKGLLILNNDNKQIKEIKNHSKAKVISYGKNKDSDIKIVNTEKTKDGQIIRIEQENKTKEYKINRFGEHHAYVCAAKLAFKNYFKI